MAYLPYLEVIPVTMLSAKVLLEPDTTSTEPAVSPFPVTHTN